MASHGASHVHLMFIGVGGFAGAIARYVVDGWVARLTAGSFPWGTMVVNLSGAFALGLRWRSLGGDLSQ